MAKNDCEILSDFAFFFAFLTPKMTSKFKFDLIRPAQFGGGRAFCFYEIFHTAILFFRHPGCSAFCVHHPHMAPFGRGGGDPWHITGRVWGKWAPNLSTARLCTVLCDSVLFARIRYTHSFCLKFALQNLFNIFEYTYSIGTLWNYQNFVKSRHRPFE